jgi:hypothetical protein
MQGFAEAVHPRTAQSENTMKRTSQPTGKDLPSRLFASNPALLMGAAFELGMLLGKRTGKTAMGRKVRESVTEVADRVVQLAPDAVVNLVPELAPAKARARRRTGKK